MLRRAWSLALARLRQRWRLGIVGGAALVARLRRQWRLVVVVGGAALVVLLAGYGGAAAYWVGDLRHQADTLEDSLQGWDIMKLDQRATYGPVLESLSEVTRDTRWLRLQLAPLRAFRWVPGVGGRVGQALAVLDSVHSLGRAASLTLEAYVGEDGLALVSGQGPAELPEGARRRLVAAAEELGAAERLRARLDGQRALMGLTKRYLENYDRLVPALRLAVRAGLEAPGAFFQVAQLRDQVQQLRESVDISVGALRSLPETRQTLQAMREEAASLTDQLGGLLEARQEGLGGLSESDEALVRAAMKTAMLLESLTAAGERAAIMAEAVLHQGLFTPEFGNTVGVELAALRRDVERSQVLLDELARVALPATDIQGDAPGMADLSRVISSLRTRASSLLERVNRFALFAEDSLGFQGPRRYLVVAQNNDEIRATGGFLGVVAEVTLENGILTSVRYRDSTTVDREPLENNPVPPEPIYRYLWMGRFLFRDANWHPSFPVAAGQLADLYLRGTGVQVDGVVAVTKEVVVDLVDALGSVTVPEVPGPIDGATARRYVDGELSYPCLPRHVSFRSKRCFDEDLFQSILDLSTGTPPSGQQEAVFEVMERRMKAKDLLFHPFSEQATAVAWELGLNGGIPQVDHDFLMVVDSSLPGHASGRVEREVEYRISLSTDGPSEATLRVRYQNRGLGLGEPCRQTATTKEGCFWDYFRIYVPIMASSIVAPSVPVHDGSEWLVWGYEDPESRKVTAIPRAGLSGLAEIAGYLTVEPQSVTTLPVTYELPSTMLRRVAPDTYQYRLRLEKQSGVEDGVSVFVELPPGAELVGASPGVQGRNGGWLSFVLQMQQSTDIVLSFKMPPRAG
ncbi:MAG: DUF4012 domain-containing protein [Chloroflexi bacterium]|nr:DUF4012 domain-containing protein [Chloroflexota bacterium]